MNPTLKETAIHEVGQGVIFHMIGFDIDEVSIIPEGGKSRVYQYFFLFTS
jgi:hypothetical protein